MVVAETSLSNFGSEEDHVDFNWYTRVNITLSHGRDQVMSKSQTNSLDWQKIKHHMFHQWKNSSLQGFMTCGSHPVELVVT